MPIIVGKLNEVSVNADGMVTRTHLSPRFEAFIKSAMKDDTDHFRDSVLWTMLVFHSTAMPLGVLTPGLTKNGRASYASKVQFSPSVVFYIRTSATLGENRKAARYEREFILPDELTGDELMDE